MSDDNKQAPWFDSAMDTGIIPESARRAAPVGVAEKAAPSKIMDTDSARAYLLQWMCANFPSDKSFGVYIQTTLAGDFAYQLARALEGNSAAHIASKPNTEPVTHLRWWARQINEGHGNIGHEEGYEVCKPGELSDDGTPAFPVYATPAASAPTVQEGAAIDANGTTYHNVAEIYHQAEECEALHMWLDDQGVPRADAEGKVCSPVGRVMGMAQDAARFRWLNADHDAADVREQARSLAKRLGTSSYFAITRDIDAAMLAAAPAAPSASADAVVEASGKSLNARVADLLRPFLEEGQKVIWREPFRWHDDNGVLSNHYDGLSIEGLAEDFNYHVPRDFNFNHAVIVGPRVKSGVLRTGEGA